ncbi:hypothetical protein BAUCODRAFT_35446 [Baudoinia panamericana UAMH 10762]|uniref:Uncharacterized protein n=1 Tax=Baudoinia panamericana (strain UAMH 10762) TaxID=717646 RepID=M2MFP7_BAUPA|nr:uncharacterized protein BAUCODRAFT_35446 [Baudoinia panamericana UAMH 10762]EMC95466.1 hypothetical protein BAUCODRAFT_35446 [Baudoinia panamericana UAMH 10762]
MTLPWSSISSSGEAFAESRLDLSETIAALSGGQIRSWHLTTTSSGALDEMGTLSSISTNFSERLIVDSAGTVVGAGMGQIRG